MNVLQKVNQGLADDRAHFRLRLGREIGSVLTNTNNKAVETMAGTNVRAASDCAAAVWSHCLRQQNTEDRIESCPHTPYIQPLKLKVGWALVGQ